MLRFERIKPIIFASLGDKLEFGINKNCQLFVEI